MDTAGTPIIFFGNERIATAVTTSTPTIRALLTAGYDIKAIVSNHAAGTSRSKRRLEIQEIAERYSIPLLLPKNLTDIADQLKSYGAEIGVLVAYGKIVPQAIIDIFPGGIVNIHPSLLPLHRGPTPLESVILSGEIKTGVSVMALVKEMDAGPVYGQSTITLTGHESKQLLADKLLAIGSEKVVSLLPGIISGQITPEPQDNTAVTYDKLINKEDGIIDWTKPASQIEREIRAYQGWPKSTTRLAGKDVTICSVRLLNVQGKPGSVNTIDNQMVVYCAGGALILDSLKPAGKNEMTGQAFLAGYRDLL